MHLGGHNFERAIEAGHQYLGPSIFSVLLFYSIINSEVEFIFSTRIYLTNIAFR